MIIERVKKCADFVITTGATVRDAAHKFGVSKSTSYLDLTQRLEKIDMERYNKAKKVLMLNKSERHFRGGESTRRRYESMG